jgi:hypothetical protein
MNLTAAPLRSPLGFKQTVHYGALGGVQVGDGTTTVVILAGELLKESKAFIEEGVHPQVAHATVFVVFTKYYKSFKILPNKPRLRHTLRKSIIYPLTSVMRCLCAWKAPRMSYGYPCAPP